MKPEIIIGVDPGRHNQDMEATLKRLEVQGAYKDMSTILIIPCLGTVPTKVVSSWLNMYWPPNQKVIKMWPIGFEVGSAYSECIEQILAHPDLSKYRFIATLEHDNVPQPDGFIRLLQQMDQHPEYAAISGLYYTKFENGVPQCWGDVSDPCLNFRPVPPKPGELIEVNGIGMGMAVFRMDMFKDERMRKPWFKTTASQAEGCYTQDLWFATDAKKNGYRFGVDCSVLCGHYDLASDVTW